MNEYEYEYFDEDENETESTELPYTPPSQSSMDTEGIRTFMITPGGLKLALLTTVVITLLIAIVLAAICKCYRRRQKMRQIVFAAAGKLGNITVLTPTTTLLKSGENNKMLDIPEADTSNSTKLISNFAVPLPLPGESPLRYS